MATIYINENSKKGYIHPEIQGMFSEHLGRGIYEGIYVRPESGIANINGMRCDVVGALKEIDVPVLRWPGGCFADEYHWQDGIGPKETRKKMINTHWGNVLEDNSFGTHEFFELVRQLGCKSYVNGNVGSGTVREMSEWVEYMTFEGISPMADLRRRNGHEEPWTIDYFGVGNENWGCGGNMRPEYYGDLYRRYATYCRTYSPDRKFQKICCGPGSPDTGWTKGVLKTCFQSEGDYRSHGHMDLLSMHYYVVPGKDWEHKGSAVDFDRELFYDSMKKTLFTEKFIKRHLDVLDIYDPEKKIGVSFDEWGGWYDVEKGTNPGFLYQQNTMRDALIAGTTLNIFNRHCDRIRMACLAQTVNVLQSVILTEGDRMILTPTYHVFHMYKAHQGAELLDCTISDNATAGTDQNPITALDVSASTKDGAITVTLTNMDADNAYPIEVIFSELRPEKVLTGVVSGDMHAHNTFDDPGQVTEKVLDNVSITERGCRLEIPACAVIALTIR